MDVKNVAISRFEGWPAAPFLERDGQLTVRRQKISKHQSQNVLWNQERITQSRSFRVSGGRI